MPSGNIYKSAMKTDLSYLNEMSGGNKELIQEMISIFMSQVDEFAKDMETYLQNKDYEKLGKLAHKAKSSVSIMGLSKLAKDLKILEELTKEGKENIKYQKIVKNFRDETSEAVEELLVVKKNIELYF
jgi:HPt (histidine-containing phosphotransfer) domain-containing protein